MRSFVNHEDVEEDTEQEITLSTASLLGLFVCLVLVCGVFFGFGYSVGRRTMAQIPPAAKVANSGHGTDHGAAPALTSPEREATADDASSLVSSDLPAPLDTSPQSSQPGPVGLPMIEAPAPVGPSSAAPQYPATALQAPEETRQPSHRATAITETTGKMSKNRPAFGQAAGQTMVQIAAVANREDAEVLVSALRQRGYSAVVRTEPQDKLLHVQIGPFASRDQASAMRQKLLSDGYNAIIKR